MPTTKKGVKTKRKETSLKPCPIKFLWGTFCRGVLSEGEARTVHEVWPGFKIDGFPTPDAPEFAKITLQKLAVFAVVERVDLLEQQEIDVELDLCLESRIAISQRTNVLIQPGQSHSQITVALAQLELAAPTALGNHLLTPSMAFCWQGVELGRVELRVFIENRLATKPRTKKDAL